LDWQRLQGPKEDCRPVNRGIERRHAAQKSRAFIALAIAVTQLCTPCIDLRVKALIKAGATRDELEATLAMCVQMGGGPALMYAAHALAAWDEFSTPAPQS